MVRCVTELSLSLGGDHREATKVFQVYVWGVGLLGLGPALQKVDRPVLMDPPLFGKEKASFRCLMPIAHSKEDNLINKLLHNVLVRFIFLRLHPLQVAKVYAGNTSAGALTSNGRLYVWGQNRLVVSHT